MLLEWKPYQHCRLFTSHYLSPSCSSLFLPYPLLLASWSEWACFGVVWFSLVNYNIWSWLLFWINFFPFFLVLVLFLCKFNFPSAWYHMPQIFFFTLRVSLKIKPLPMNHRSMLWPQSTLIYSSCHHGSLLSNCKLNIDVFFDVMIVFYNYRAYQPLSICVCM